MNFIEDSGDMHEVVIGSNLSVEKVLSDFLGDVDFGLPEFEGIQFFILGFCGPVFFGNDGDSVLRGESGIADIGVPFHGIAKLEGVVQAAHHFADGQVVECSV